MSSADTDGTSNCQIFLHPSVGLRVHPDAMTPSQKVAAVAKVRCLEHDLFDGERVRRDLSRQDVESIVVQLNQLRRALGWLEIDLEGRLRWPHLSPASQTAI
jgi:hypothetical protein